MIVTYFRSSSYNCHDDCAQRYLIEYILGWTGLSGQAATKGTIVHKVLEILALYKQAEQNSEDTIFDEEVMKERKLSSLKDVNKIIDEVYTFYTKNNPHIDWKNADKLDCAKWTKMALIMNDGEFDPRNRTIVSPEQSFDISLKNYDWSYYSYDYNGEKIEGHLSIKGTIDLITEVDKDTYEIIDWKSGAKKDWVKGGIPKTDAMLQKDPQLMLYYFAASHLYPGKDMLLTINFIRDGGATTIAFTDKNITMMENLLRKKFEEIKATRIPKLNRSWKCSKLCNAGKTTFRGSNIHAQVEDRDNQVTPVGDTRTVCEQVRYMVKEKGIDWVTKNYTKPNFSVGNYRAPGSV
jgi:hypothetical protein